MSARTSSTSCPRCGAAARGSFCAACGAPLEGAKCGACSRPLTPGAAFCHHCGTPAAAALSSIGRLRNAAPWMVAGGVLLLLVAFIAGQQVGRRPVEPPPPDVAGLAAEGGAVRAPDISRMSPQERATRLFNRVMRYSEAGMTDSAALFAPMAIQAYEMIGPLDAHARFDIGVILAVSGDAASARAQADTILRTNPAHLLGLVLAIRAADPATGAAAKAQFARRLVTAEGAERRKGLPEYTEHQRDIDDALAAAAAAQKARP